jgi:NAD(P)-dependent dehydrogenase (short-subunit alcohol dehydrogenase family)
MLGVKPHATSMPYGVSKAAMNMLAQSFVKEFAPRGVRVNVVSPGFVATESQDLKPQWLREKIESKIAMRRFATEQEVADICLSVINNTYINGAIVPIDGGYEME